MRTKCFTALIAALFMVSAVFPQIGGTVDWTARIVKATGIGAGPEGPNQRPMAIRAAKQDALRNALELIKGMSLNAQTTVANSMVEDDMINTSVSGFVQGFEYEPNPHYMSDGTVEITVTLPFDGANGLNNSLFGGSANLVSDKPTATFKPSGVRGRGFSGLIVDAKGIGVKPALMPKIIDEEKREIYGSAYVSRKFAVKYGMCGYAKDLAGAQKQTDRIGKSPCVVKGLKVSGPNKADIIIAKADADLVRSVARNARFLSECRVIIVLD